MKVFVTVLENGSVLVNNLPITSIVGSGSPTVFERRMNKDDVVKTLMENGFAVGEINVEPYLSEIQGIK